MPNSAITFNTAGLASASSPGLVGTGAQTFAGKKTLDGGALIKGDITGVDVAPGYIGEQLRVYSGGVSIAATSNRTIVSVDLTPGIWDISAIAWVSGTTVSGEIFLSTALNGNTGRVIGDNTMMLAANQAACIPQFRVATSTSVTWRLNTYVSGATTIAGRISAVRIA